MRYSFIVLFGLMVTTIACSKWGQEIESNPQEQYPESGVNIALCARMDCDDYVKATFSFIYGTRDNLELTNNNWELLYEKSQYNDSIVHMLLVNMVTDDCSSIADLGIIDFESLQEIPAGTVFAHDANAQLNHVYIIYNKDTYSKSLAKIVITEIGDAAPLKFDWVRSTDGFTFD